MEENITDVENKVAKMLQLIKEKDEYRKDDSELVQLVEDFQKQYKSLFALYDNLRTGESESPASDGKEKERFSLTSSSSSSDSEYYSPVANVARRSFLKNERMKEANTEVAELKNELVSKIEETEALVSDYMADLSTIQEAETINRNMRNHEVDEREKGLAAILGMCEVSGNSPVSSPVFGKTEDLEIQIRNLKVEMETLFSQKRDLEADFAFKDAELKKLSEKNISMEARVLELQRIAKKGSQLEVQVKILKEELSRKTAAEEKLLTDTENALVQVKNLKQEKNDMVEQLTSKIKEIGQLREENEPVSVELETLRNRNRQLEQDIAEEREGYSLSLSAMEEQNANLTSKILDQQRILDEQEKTINKSKEDTKLLKRWSWSMGTSTTNHSVLERKMEDLADESRKKLEDNIRLLLQRIRVAEKIHYETKENYQKIKETFEEENLVLKQKVESYESEAKKLRNTLQPWINTLVGLDLAVKKLEDRGSYLTRLKNAASEVVCVKNWVLGKNSEVKQLKSKMNFVLMQLEDKVEHEFLLREKVWSLEATRSEEMEEKVRLVEAVSELETKVEEKDEEKREVIRQLCVLVDYHCERYDRLMEMFSKSKRVK